MPKQESDLLKLNRALQEFQRGAKDIEDVEENTSSVIKLRPTAPNALLGPARGCFGGSEVVRQRFAAVRGGSVRVARAEGEAKATGGKNTPLAPPAVCGISNAPRVPGKNKKRNFAPRMELATKRAVF